MSKVIDSGTTAMLSANAPEIEVAGLDYVAEGVIDHGSARSIVRSDVDERLLASNALATLRQDLLSSGEQKRLDWFIGQLAKEVLDPVIFIEKVTRVPQVTHKSGLGFSAYTMGRHSSGYTTSA